MADGILHAHLSYTSRFPALTASDPSWVFAIKSLLHPVVAVACLLGCMLAWREPLYGPYFLLAVLTFFTAAQFLDIVRCAERASSATLARIYSRPPLAVASHRRLSLPGTASVGDQ
jgi:hypothetical protein